MQYKTTVLVILLMLGITGGISWLYIAQGEKNEEKLNKTMIGEKIPEMGRGHVKPGQSHAEYNSNPPTSGPHWVGVAGPGIKAEPVADELVLHSMEHGAAVVWYREGLDPSEIAKIKTAFNSSSGKKIMLARKDLDVPVALTSWGYLLKLDMVDEDKIKEFIETNNDRAPEKAPV